MRIALGLEYDGSSYGGWQRQKHSENTVQEYLEKGLSYVANEAITVTCAGRTDSGVHATGQVVHFDTDVQRSSKAWVFGANTNTPLDISVQWALPVADDFHARFQANGRHYRYVIHNAPVRSALMGKQITWNYQYLDADRMQQAANYLLGVHDFTSFRAAGCQAKNPVKTMERINVVRDGDLIVLDVVADAFLYHMVRNIAGVLMAIGVGDANPEWAKQVLEAKDRTKGGVTASPCGLYLVGVRYPESCTLPVLAPGPAFLSGHSVNETENKRSGGPVDMFATIRHLISS